MRKVIISYVDGPLYQGARQERFTMGPYFERDAPRMVNNIAVMGGRDFDIKPYTEPSAVSG